MTYYLDPYPYQERIITISQQYKSIAGIKININNIQLIHDKPQESKSISVDRLLNNYQVCCRSLNSQNAFFDGHTTSMTKKTKMK